MRLNRTRGNTCRPANARRAAPRLGRGDLPTSSGPRRARTCRAPTARPSLDYTIKL
jgi:hypothetical protein